MKTDTKKSAPGSEPGTRAAGGLTRQNGRLHYTQFLNKLHALSVKEQRALWWLEQDFLLLPAQPNTKKLVHRYGAYQKKITTPEGVYQWFGKTSLANLAVCGTQTSLILDFDNPDLYRSWAEQFPKAARTYTEQTPRGGFHVFAHTWGESLKGFMPINGVELKRVVLVSPSTVDNKPYTQGAGELLDLDADLVLSPLRQTPRHTPAPRTDIPGEGILPKIKSAFSCLDLIRSSNDQIKVYGSGRRFITLPCPFHDDKEPSFWIDTQRNLWGCHACGTRGDVINLYARLQGITVREAIRELRRKL